MLNGEQALSGEEDRRREWMPASPVQARQPAWTVQNDWGVKCQQQQQCFSGQKAGEQMKVVCDA